MKGVKESKEAEKLRRLEIVRFGGWEGGMDMQGAERMVHSAQR